MSTQGSFRPHGFIPWEDMTDSEKIDLLANLLGWSVAILLALIIYVGTR